jgi:hypothetical protein
MRVQMRDCGGGGGFGSIIVCDEEDEDDDDCLVVEAVVIKSIIIFSSAEGRKQSNRKGSFVCMLPGWTSDYIALGCASARPIPRCAKRNKRQKPGCWRLEVGSAYVVLGCELRIANCELGGLRMV